MWEIAAQQEPWPDIDGNFVCTTLLDKLSAGERPPVAAEWQEDYVVVMTSCWAFQPESRPPFNEIVTVLQKYNTFV